MTDLHTRIAELAVDHAETGHLDTPKERALRLDLEQADAEVQILKTLLAKTRLAPLSEEVEAMFYWRKKAIYYEELLDRLGMNPRERFDRLAALKEPT